MEKRYSRQGSTTHAIPGSMLVLKFHLLETSSTPAANMHSGHRLLKAAVALWELTQVELHGRFSAARIHKLRLFLAKTSIQEAVAICLTLPLATVLVLGALETIPLAPLSAGSRASYGFWIRHITTLIVLSPGILSNFRTLLPELNITRLAMMAIGVCGSIASGGAVFIVSLFIGFPVPFTLLASAPAWLIVVIPPTISIYVRRMRHNHQLLERFIRCWLIISWLAASVVIYPLYVFGFHRFGSYGQTLYVGVLPLMKITARNVISWLIGNRADVKAEIVIFNVEVFSAMYMSVALQNTAKLSTTFAVMAVDIVQAKVAISDIDKMLKSIKQKFYPTAPRRTTLYTMAFDHLGPSTPCQQEKLSKGKLTSIQQVGPEASLIPPSVGHLFKPSPTQILPAPPVKTPAKNQIKAEVLQTLDGNLPASDTLAQPPLKFLPKKNSERFLLRSAQVLYTAEFVLLVKYVEAMVPALYVAAAFVMISYTSPNRNYYAQFDSITPSNVNNTVLNVMVYCVLKMLSFWVMCFILSRKLGVPAVHLVAFVVANQWEAVFSKVVTWVTYTTLTSLKHSGPDFTFQFAWLRKSPSE